MPADFYDVLDASPDADQDDLKSAYRERVREYHPDVNDDEHAEEQFKLVRKGYEVLSDPGERKDYDRLGHRDYVDKHMGGLPSLAVFGDGDAEDGTRSSRTSVRESGGSSSSTTGSSGTATSTTSAQSTTGTGSTGSSGNGSRGKSSGTSRTDSGTASRSSRSTETSSGTSTGSGKSTGSTSGASTSGSSSTSSGTSSSATSGATTSTQSTASTATDSGGSTTGTGPSHTRRQASTATGTKGGTRRAALKRWYGVVALALVCYLAGLGVFAAANRGAALEFATAIASDPTATLLGSFPLPSPTAFARGAMTTPSTRLVFPAGVAVLPLVLGWTVVRYGRGKAYLYALVTFGPAVYLATGPVVPSLAWLAVLALVVLPVLGALAFLVDVGRYLLGSR